MILDLKGGSLIGVHIILDRGDEIANGTLHECVIDDVFYGPFNYMEKDCPLISKCTISHCQFLSREGASNEGQRIEA